jgi:FkbM family methyltransferase
MINSRSIYNFINIFLKFFNIRLKRTGNSNKEIFESILYVKNNLLHKKNDKIYYSFLNHILNNYHLSFSERFQDIFIDWLLNKRNGSFIEFGACDGIHISNTYFLEKYRGWSGILLEPAKIWHNKLKVNRPNCIIDFRCVSHSSNHKINFYENANPVYSSYKNNYSKKKSYIVETVSLNDIILQYRSFLEEKSNQNNIDFISIDTEGSEYEILKNFDFIKYSPKIIIVEHNFNKKKSKQLKELLESNGYANLFPELSAYDYYFVLNNILLKKINE